MLLSCIFATTEPEKPTLQDSNLNLKIYIRYLKTNYYIRTNRMKKNNFSRRAFLSTGALVATGAAAAGMNIKGFNDLDPQEVSEENLQASSYSSETGHSSWTDAVHAGERSENSSYPIYQGTTNPNYSRDGNPTIDSVEEKIATLEGAEYGVAAACGMAAISQTLLTYLKQGSRMVYHRCIYDGAIGLIDSVLKPNGVDCKAIDMTDLSQLKVALTKKTAVVYFEIHSNPTIDVIDVAEAVKLAHNKGAIVIIDNTFLTPYLIQPLALGADIVIHSATKYMMGHGNGLVGISCGSKELIVPIKKIRKYVGGIMAPFNAFLLHQGLKTLPMRIERHCSNAMKVAEFLNDHPKIKRVHYPGLSNDPGHEIAKKQMKGFGGMMGFELNSSKALKEFEIVLRKTSLGDVHTLLSTGFIERKRRGIPENFYRLSIGIENPDDLIADFEKALEKV
jgi:methionine-gamma-lyase